MKRLVSLVISLVIGCITLPLAAIAGITGGASSDPACNHQPAPTGPDRQPAASSRWDTEQLANAATIIQVGDSAAEFVSGGEGEVEALEVAGSFWS
jgi:hypothetical protein